MFCGAVDGILYNFQRKGSYNAGEEKYFNL